MGKLISPCRLGPGQSAAPLPVGRRRLGESGQGVGGFVVPRNGVGVDVGVEMIDRGSAAEDHVGPGLGQHSGQGQRVEGGLQPRGLTFQHGQRW